MALNTALNPRGGITRPGVNSGAEKKAGPTGLLTQPNRTLTQHLAKEVVG